MDQFFCCLSFLCSHPARKQDETLQCCPKSFGLHSHSRGGGCTLTTLELTRSETPQAVVSQQGVSYTQHLGEIKARKARADPSLLSAMPLNLLLSTPITEMPLGLLADRHKGPLSAFI